MGYKKSLVGGLELCFGLVEELLLDPEKFLFRLARQFQLGDFLFSFLWYNDSARFGKGGTETYWAYLELLFMVFEHIFNFRRKWLEAEALGTRPWRSKEMMMFERCLQAYLESRDYMFGCYRLLGFLLAYFIRLRRDQVNKLCQTRDP